MIKNIYGFSKIIINGHEAYTTLIMLSRFDNYGADRTQILKKHDIPFTITKGCNKLVISSLTLNEEEHRAFVKSVGAALKEIALETIESKYSYATPIS